MIDLHRRVGTWVDEAIITVVAAQAHLHLHKIKVYDYRDIGDLEMDRY